MVSFHIFHLLLLSLITNCFTNWFLFIFTNWVVSIFTNWFLFILANWFVFIFTNSFMITFKNRFVFLYIHKLGCVYIWKLICVYIWKLVFPFNALHFVAAHLAVAEDPVEDGPEGALVPAEVELGVGRHGLGHVEPHVLVGVQLRVGLGFLQRFRVASENNKLDPIATQH